MDLRYTTDIIDVNKGFYSSQYSAMPRIGNRLNRNEIFLFPKFDQYPSIKIETVPTDLPTQEVDATKTRRGTLREYISYET